MTLEIMRKSAGVAAIEMAAALTALVTLVLGALGMVFVLHKYMAVQAAVDKYAYDRAVKALQLVSTISGAAIVVNDAALDAWIQTAATGLRNELQAGLDSPRDKYWIESSYAVLNFDPATGVSQGVGELPYRNHYTLGELSISSELGRKSDPGREFSRLAALTQGIEPEALFALPNGLYGREDSAFRYQEKLVAVHIRAFVSFAGGLGGRIYSWLGGEPVAWSAKAVVLRREL